MGDSSAASTSSRTAASFQHQVDPTMAKPPHHGGRDSTLVPDDDLERNSDSRQTQADTALHAEEDCLQRKGDIIWVDFDPKHDAEDPFQWSQAKKWYNTGMTCFFTILVASGASTYVSGIPEMERDLGVNNRVIFLLGVSLYALGFSLPPLVLAPFSEALGRKTIYIVTYTLWAVLFLGVGFAKNITTVLILRFLQGAFGSTGSTMVGGTISDMFRTAERGVPMALFAIGGIGGTGLGPVWAGWVAQYLNWRWVQWISAAFAGAFGLLFLFTVDESRGSVLLARRAKRLRKETGDERYRARAEEERASMATLIKTSLTRPLWLLISEPIVLSFSSYISLQWGVMYALLESLGLIANLHNYTTGQTGLLFLTLFVASLIGFATNFIQEALYKRYYSVKGPEARLYAACVGAVVFPAGCLIYAWTSYANVSIAGPIVGVLVLMVAIYHVYLAVFNYLSDSYLLYASSALAAQSFLRNVLGFAFPLFVTQMYENLTYPWASTLIALLGVLLGIVPFVLYRFGHRIRARSRFYQRLQREEAERIARVEAIAASVGAEMEKGRTEGEGPKVGKVA